MKICDLFYYTVFILSRLNQHVRTHEGRQAATDKVVELTKNTLEVLCSTTVLVISICSYRKIYLVLAVVLTPICFIVENMFDQIGVLVFLNQLSIESQSTVHMIDHIDMCCCAKGKK